MLAATFLDPAPASAQPKAPMPAMPREVPHRFADLPADPQPDVALARQIALIRADVAVADELVRARDWASAARHAKFPLEEVYGSIREDLRTYKVPGFDGALKVLVRTVRARNQKQYPKALKKVEDALAAADAALRERQPHWPRFTVTVAMAVLKAAPEEYEDAVVKDRIARPISYQMARGIVLEAERLVESVAGAVPDSDVAALRRVRMGFAALKPGFVALRAPREPSLDVATVRGAVAAIDAAARSLTAPSN
jgi:hypothetical protein